MSQKLSSAAVVIGTFRITILSDRISCKKIIYKENMKTRFYLCASHSYTSRHNLFSLFGLYEASIYGCMGFGVRKLAFGVCE